MDLGDGTFVYKIGDEHYITCKRCLNNIITKSNKKYSLQRANMKISQVKENY